MLTNFDYIHLFSEMLAQNKKAAVFYVATYPLLPFYLVLIHRHFVSNMHAYFLASLALQSIVI